MTITIHVHEETTAAGKVRFAVHDSAEDFGVKWHNNPNTTAGDLAKRSEHYEKLGCAVTVRAPRWISDLAGVK